MATVFFVCYNKIVANKEDSDHLVLAQKHQHMVNKHNCLEIMFEHLSKEIYDLATKEGVSKLINSPRRNYYPAVGTAIYVVKQRLSKNTLMDKASILDKKNGGKSHVETMHMIFSWQNFSFQLMIR